MSDLLPRIKELLQWRGLGPAAFADEIGVARPVLSHIISARNKVSLEVVQKILSTYPEVSSEWLLLGVDGMLKKLEDRNEYQREENSDTIAEEALQNTQVEKTATRDKVQDCAEVEGQTVAKDPRRKVIKVVLFYSDGYFEQFDQLATLN